MRILVVGGRGFLGSRTVTALRHLPDAEVVVGSRRGGEGHVAIDLSDYSSRTAMEGFDFVVNCADSLEVAPDRAAEFCLHQGITFVETSADGAVIEQLRAKAMSVPDPKGVLVLSAGLFPGLSNLLAAKLCTGEQPARLEVGVRYSPLSKAGRGVSQLMVSTVARETARYEAGQVVLDPPLTVGGALPFSGGQRRAMGVGWAESTMLHWSLGVPSTGTFLAPVPPLPLTVQRLLTLFVPWSWLRLDAVRWLVASGVRLLRSGLLRWRTSSVEITAVRDREADGVHGAFAWVKVDDGFAGAAYAIAASVASLAARVEPPAPGVHLVDEVLTFDDVVERMRTLGEGALRIEVGASASRAQRR